MARIRIARESFTEAELLLRRAIQTAEAELPRETPMLIRWDPRYALSLEAQGKASDASAIVRKLDDAIAKADKTADRNQPPTLTRPRDRLGSRAKQIEESPRRAPLSRRSSTDAPEGEPVTSGKD